MRSAPSAEKIEYAVDDTPPCARRFLHTIIRPELVNVAQNQRNMRELEVLAQITDLLAQGRNGEAADSLVHRMIAVRMAIEDGNWSKAAFVELTPQDTSSMIPNSLRQMALKEADSHRKLQLANSSDTGSNEQSGGKPWNQRPWMQDKYKNKPWMQDKNVEGKGAKGGKGKKK